MRARSRQPEERLRLRLPGTRCCRGCGLSCLAGALVGATLGLSTGGTMLFAVLAASASYIAVPAAMRVAVPDADPGIYLTLSLGITFPFNLTIGIPLYLEAARMITGA